MGAIVDVNSCVIISFEIELLWQVNYVVQPLPGLGHVPQLQLYREFFCPSGSLHCESSDSLS